MRHAEMLSAIASEDRILRSSTICAKKGVFPAQCSSQFHLSTTAMHFKCDLSMWEISIVTEPKKRLKWHEHGFDPLSLNTHTPRGFPSSLVVKILPSTAEGVGSIPGQGTKVTHAGHSQK